MFFLYSGEYYSIVVYDMYGFECFPYNGLEQLMINSLNEQMQYIYNQWIFVNNIIELVDKFKLF